MRIWSTSGQILVTCLTVLGLASTAARASDNRPVSSGKTPRNEIRNETRFDVSDPQEKWELRAAPLQALYRFYSAEFAYRFSNRWSAGPSVVVYDSPGDMGGMLGPTYHGAAFGLNTTYYFNSPASNTLYWGAHVFYQSYTSYGHAYRGYSERSGGRMETVVGYQWRWNPMSLRVGGGAQYENEDVRNVSSGYPPEVPDEISTSRKATLFPIVELKIGIEI